MVAAAMVAVAMVAVAMVAVPGSVEVHAAAAKGSDSAAAVACGIGGRLESGGREEGEERTGLHGILQLPPW